MTDLWYGLEERLKCIANNKANGGSEGVAIIYVNLVYTQDNELAGWYKPQRISLEPKAFNIAALLAGKKRLPDWQQAIRTIKKEQAKLNNNLWTVNKALVVLDGLPIGFL